MRAVSRGRRSSFWQFGESRLFLLESRVSSKSVGGCVFWGCLFSPVWASREVFLLFGSVEQLNTQAESFHRTGAQRCAARATHRGAAVSPPRREKKKQQQNKYESKRRASRSHLGGERATEPEENTGDDRWSLPADAGSGLEPGRKNSREDGR